MINKLKIHAVNSPLINITGVYLPFILILLTLSQVIFSFQLHAQENDLKFRRLTINDGLSQSKVNCIFQDSRGFMWFGTNEGLNKYDGYEFTIFQKDYDKLGDLSAIIIYCIYEDSRDNLWLGAADGLYLYDRASNRFTHFSPKPSSEIKISGNAVYTILEDSRGNLWLASNYGIDLFDLENRKCTNYVPSHLTDEQSKQSRINLLFEDRQNNLWFATLEDGLGLFNRKNKTYEYFQHDSNNKRSLSSNNIRSIYEDSQGDLWIGTYDGGFNLFDRTRKEFYHFSPNPEVIESFTVKAMLEDGKGNLFIGTRNGLYLFNKNVHQFIRYGNDPHNPLSLSQNNVQAIFRDAKGDFWFGTKAGINFLNTTNIPFHYYRADINNNRYLNHKTVSAILEDGRGDLWFGTAEGGVNKLNRKTGIYTYYMHDPNDPTSISSNNIVSIAEDKNGNLWIGTFQGGVNFFNRKENKFIRYIVEPDVDLLHPSQSYLVFIDRDGDIWIGGSSLFRVDKKTHEFIPFPLNTNSTEPVITYITQDKEGNIWVACENGRLYSIEKKTLKIELFRTGSGDNNITLTYILAEDMGKNLWIATRGEGIYHFDRKQNTFHSYTTKHGLTSNNVNDILEDSHGGLWLSTSKGISNYNPKTKNFKNYYKENGLQANLFTRASCKTRSGEMFFGGVNGVTAFYPDKIVSNSFIPPVFITDFKIFNKSVEIGGEYPILEKHISESKKIELSYKDAVFTFTFTALNFAISQQNQFTYMMEGFETEWNYVDSKKRFATYTNLDPGTYIFKVKAANNDGLWNEEGTSIEVNISPPFWQSLWFKMIILAVIFLIIWHLVNHLIQKRNLLKATALANLSQLKLLRNQMNPHFLFNALGSIRSLIHINKEKAWQLVSELSEFLQYTLLNYNKLEATLDEEIEAAHNYLNIEKIQYEEPLKVSFEVDDKARKCVVPAFMLQPLLENAIKHGLNDRPDQFEIIIRITVAQDLLSIDIANTGQLNNVTDDMSKDSDPHGTSIINIRKRLKLIFKNEFDLQLFEEAGWVHTKINIDYKRCRKTKPAITEEAG